MPQRKENHVKKSWNMQRFLLKKLVRWLLLKVCSMLLIPLLGFWFPLEQLNTLLHLLPLPVGGDCCISDAPGQEVLYSKGTESKGLSIYDNLPWKDPAAKTPMASSILDKEIKVFFEYPDIEEIKRGHKGGWTTMNVSEIVRFTGDYFWCIHESLQEILDKVSNQRCNHIPDTSVVSSFQKAADSWYSKYNTYLDELVGKQFLARKRDELIAKGVEFEHWTSKFLPENLDSTESKSSLKRANDFRTDNDLPLSKRQRVHK
jgi:hypothetical protein